MRWPWTVGVIVTLALMLIPAFVPGIIAAPASTAPSSPTASTTSNLMTLPGGFVVGPAPTHSAAPSFDAKTASASGLKSILEWDYGKAIDPYVAQASGYLPLWASALRAYANGDNESQVASLLAPMFNTELVLFTVGAGAVAGLGIGCLVTGFNPIGCLIGAIAGAVVALVICLFSFSCSGLGGGSLRMSAVIEAQTMVGGLAEVLEGNSNSTYNLLSALNATTVPWEYDAANAAISQIGNSSFSNALDLQQSGILPQFIAMASGTAAETAAIIATEMSSFGEVFGPNGFYGAQGVVCNLKDYAFGTSGSALTDPNLYSGYSYDSGQGCYDETGNPGNEQLLGNGQVQSPINGGGTQLYTPPGVVPGVIVPIGAPYTASDEIYVVHGATFFNAPPPTGYSGPNYVGFRLSPIAGTGSVTTDVVAQNGQFATYNGPNGSFTFQPRTCSTSSDASCSNTNASGSIPIWVSNGILSVNTATQANMAIAAGFNATGATTHDIFSGLFFACGGGYTPAVIQASVNSPVSVFPCSGSDNHLLSSIGTLLRAAVNVANAYWLFLRGHGWTAVSQIPSNCFLPSVIDVVPLNLPASVIANMTPQNLTLTYIWALTQIAQDFNESNLNGTTNFCGLPLPTSIGPNVNPIAWGVNATVDIYVPASSGQNFGSPSTYNITNVRAIFSPSTATGLYPVVGRTFEFSLVNFATTFYVHLSAKSNITDPLNQSSTEIARTYGNASELRGFSFPAQPPTFPQAGLYSSPKGYAAYIVSCAINTTDRGWVVRTSGQTCPMTSVTLNFKTSNYTCAVLGNCAPPPPPPIATVSCSTIPIVGAVVNTIANWFAFLGTTFACAIGWVLGFIFLVFVIIVIVYVVGAAVRSYRGE